MECRYTRLSFMCLKCVIFRSWFFCFMRVTLAQTQAFLCWVDNFYHFYLQFSLLIGLALCVLTRVPHYRRCTTWGCDPATQSEGQGSVLQFRNVLMVKSIYQCCCGLQCQYNLHLLVYFHAAEGDFIFWSDMVHEPEVCVDVSLATGKKKIRSFFLEL